MINVTGKVCNVNVTQETRSTQCWYLSGSVVFYKRMCDILREFKEQNISKKLIIIKKRVCHD